jgi:hypothetical protein
MPPFADLDLARRLERTEAENGRSFVEARARLDPQRGAACLEVAGAYALFDGVGSPVTQTFGLGLFAPIASQQLDDLEHFFASRGSETHHEVSPLAGVETFARLADRGYRPIELTSVMFLPLEGRPSIARLGGTRVKVHQATHDEAELFADVAARGWSEMPSVVPFLRDLSQVFAVREGGVSFVAELDGLPIACGALGVTGDVALLAGASTIPEGRRQGAQLALLDARLHYAAAHGCTLAMMGAAPGSASQRNAQRHGFQIAYTRVKWGLRL